MARYRDAERVNGIIQNWMWNSNTIEYLGLGNSFALYESYENELDELTNEIG